MTSGRPKQNGVDRGQRLPQVILHARAAEDAAGADCSATGLSLNGWSFMRDTQSIAFFSPPGIDQLYSGDTMITPSALRMASAQASASAGKPVEFWMSKL